MAVGCGAGSASRTAAKLRGLTGRDGEDEDPSESELEDAELDEEVSIALTADSHFCLRLFRYRINNYRI